MGASTLWAGPWKRIFSYGDMQAEYEAVRHRVGVIDVGTLGKFLLAGPDVVEFLERIYPMRVADLEPGKLRYGLMLEEGGVIIDDGTVCALEGGAFYCTVTTSGAERLESWMLDWREAWGLDVFVVNQTASLAAVNVAGPHARDLLEKLTDDPIDKESFPYLRHRRITVNGIPCLAIRLGFVGELAYELHFPAAHATELWDKILEAGKEWDIRPFGLDAQRLLRLEKGHIIISQDTDFETTPWKVHMDWAVKLDKPDFVGKAALVRAQRRSPRETLVPWKMEPGMATPAEGSIVTIGSVNMTGYYGGEAYSAAKAGLIVFMRSLAKEMAPHNILVNGVSPGLVDTGFDPLPEEVKVAHAQSLPLKRLGTPEDIAANPDSHTGRFLVPLLGQVPVRRQRKRA